MAIETIAAFCGCHRFTIMKIEKRALAKLREMKKRADLKGFGGGSRCYAVKTPRTE